MKHVVINYCHHSSGRESVLIADVGFLLNLLLMYMSNAYGVKLLQVRCATEVSEYDL